MPLKAHQHYIHDPNYKTINMHKTKRSFLTTERLKKNMSLSDFNIYNNNIATNKTYNKHPSMDRQRRQQRLEQANLCCCPVRCCCSSPDNDKIGNIVAKIRGTGGPRQRSQNQMSYSCGVGLVTSVITRKTNKAMQKEREEFRREKERLEKENARLKEQNEKEKKGRKRMCKFKRKEIKKMRIDIEKINKRANERDIDLQERLNKINNHKDAIMEICTQEQTWRKEAELEVKQHRERFGELEEEPGTGE